MTLKDNSTTDYYYQNHLNKPFGVSVPAATTQPLPVSGLDPFQAMLVNGSSFITGLVGDNSASDHPLPSGNVPCLDVGGVAGS